jgi:hypothetical protein
VACTGARPVAVTNCLNFGDPERPEVMWSFAETVRGMARACEALDTPVTGGNVSFYNETEDSAIYPTAVVGVIGLLEDYRLMLRPGFSVGRVLYLLGETFDDGWRNKLIWGDNLLVMGSLLVATGDSLINFNLGTGSSLLGLNGLQQVNASVRAIQPPQYAVGPARQRPDGTWVTRAETAQLDVTLTVQLATSQVQNILGSTLSGLLNSLLCLPILGLITCPVTQLAASESR